MELGSTVEAIFQDEVERAFREDGLAPGVMVEHYVVQLLAGYAVQQIESTPLALRMLTAVGAPLRERRRHLRRIGDTSLYVSGFWSDSLEGRLVDVDYYIEMGGTAYGELARVDGMATDPLGDVFGELAGNFVRFVGALALISRRVATPTSDRDILRLYRQWQRTKSANAAARLATLGVVPPKGDGRLQ